MDTTSNKRRASQEIPVSTSTAETSRPSKRSALALTEGNADVPSLSASLSGQGIQNCGSGNFSVGRDLIIGSEVNKINDDERLQNNRCLRDLRITDPRDDKRRIESTRGGLLSDVYQWILENHEFQRWHDDQENQLLWIKGDPGKGKTMLLCGIIDELRETSVTAVNRPETSTATDASLKNQSDTHATRAPVHITCNVSFFFCQATDERINTATAVLRGLIYLLLQEQPDLISHLRKQYDCAGKKLFDEGANIWFALSGIFKDMLQDSNLKNTYLIIDALDECKTGLPHLLGFILQASAGENSRVKWIVSSRNYPSIEKDFDVDMASQNSKIKLCLELNEKSISAAVARYIEVRVSYLAKRNEYTDSARENIQHYLLSKAQNTFLWVALVCEILRDLSHYYALEIVKSYPPGLDAIYGRMMNTIDSLHPLHAKHCKGVLAIISAVYRPISLEELAYLAELPIGASNDDRFLREIIGLCGSFLRIQEHTILFVHQSAKEYIVKVFPNWWVESQQMLLERSIKSMNETLRKDIYSLGHPGYSMDKIKIPEPDPLAPARYACIYWVDHLLESTNSELCKAGLSDDGPINSFLKHHFLHWLEALSLLEGFSEGILAITKLADFLTHILQENLPESELLRLVRDAHRFILYSRNAIENTPLQAYTSALLFSPTCSLVRSLFQHELDWITVKPLMEASWGDRIQTIENDGQWVNDIAFSHDDTRVVAKLESSTLMVWDASTGTLLETILGYEYLVKPRVSSNYDEKRLTPNMGSYRAMFEIYDSSTGDTSLKQFKTPGDVVTAIAFSEDYTQIASIGESGTIRIWDYDSCVCLRTFKDIRDSFRGAGSPAPSALTFSNDGTRLAWARDNEVHIVDITQEPGHVLGIFGGHSGTYYRPAAAFGDGDRLLAFAGGGTIRIWDIGSGICLKTLVSPNGLFTSIAFSRDGKRLVSGSASGTVDIWDISNGTCLDNHSVRDPGPVSKQYKYTQSITLSDDGDWAAWVFRDKRVPVRETKVWIWDVNSCVCAEEASQTATSIILAEDTVSIAFSPDAMHIMSSDTASRSLRVLDIGRNGHHRRSSYHLQDILSGHLHYGRIDDLFRAVFSTDFAYIIALLYDKTIVIWETNSCVEIARFGIEDLPSEKYNYYRQGDTLNSVACSYDAAWVVGGFHWGTVGIWDLSGASPNVRRFKGHRATITSVAISADAACAASASGPEGKIKVWHIKSGVCLWTFAINGRFIRSLQIAFDTTGSYLLSSIGTILWKASPDSDKEPATTALEKPRSTYCGYGIRADGTWITWNGQDLIWLPKEYRPTDSSVRSNTVVTVSRSNGLLIYKFSPGRPPIKRLS
ncbi:hypothetical protein ABW21_db0204964 [Orbilia brochopaga]|nr:hypothetical protein ABW21_db0204964 [Drechslerella brochopaga]